MGYWTSKVFPKIKKVFERSGGKKAAAAEACKGFDDSKEEINKVFEEKKLELQPRVLEIYEASSASIKTLVKERMVVDGVKRHAGAVNTFLEELVKIEFPGAKAASEASAQFGPALVPGPVFFIFEKVATFLPAAEPQAAEPAAQEEGPAAVPAGESSSKEREAAVEEGKEEAEREEEEKAPPAAAPEATAETTTMAEAPYTAAEAAEVERAPKA